MAKKMNEKAKRQSMIDHNNNSLDSETGYKDRGNDAQVHFKARALRTGDNGSHY